MLFSSSNISRFTIPWSIFAGGNGGSSKNLINSRVRPAGQEFPRPRVVRTRVHLFATIRPIPWRLPRAHRRLLDITIYILYFNFFRRHRRHALCTHGVRKFVRIARAVRLRPPPPLPPPT